jgi:hypothetical protein
MITVVRQARATMSGIRWSALLLAVAALVVLPPLLLATPHQSSSPRLGRSLEEPPAKCAAAIPAAVAQTAFIVEPPSQPPRRIACDVTLSLSHFTLDLSFDTRRGPPDGYSFS